MHEIDEWTRQGAEADRLQASGHYGTARTAYLGIARAMVQAQHVDAFVMAKVALGLLLCEVRAGSIGAASSIWRSTPEAPLGIGIYALDSGRVAVRDLMLYFLLSAFLQSLRSEKAAAAPAVDDLMTKVTTFARDDHDDALLVLALSNWKTHAAELGAAGAGAVEKIAALEQALGRQAPAWKIDFPEPAAWVAP
ncbi:MAG TPA: hypothetical protein VMJ10_27490 [Kofleriaceae bacterium]|nr:hypothetical protein [Kofleriaceae bacterium]